MNIHLRCWANFRKNPSAQKLQTRLCAMERQARVPLNAQCADVKTVAPLRRDEFGASAQWDFYKSWPTTEVDVHETQGKYIQVL